MQHEPASLAAQRILESIAGCVLEEWQIVQAACERVALVPRERLFRVGESAAFVYFVRAGLVKLVYTTRRGEEWIKNFSYENTFFASIRALQPQGRATFDVVAIEPTEIERIPYAVLLSLADRYLTWQSALRRGLELYGAKKEQREHDLLTLSATERYARFLAESSSIAHRVPQHDLARYLGVTPVALSRIRKRLRESSAA